jgi:putative addiction module component (TIGR02574 family)
MPRSLQAVEAAALELSPEERAQLAQRLLASLPRDPEVEAAWDEEISKRVADLEAGLIGTTPAEDVFVQGRSLLKK